MLRILLFLFPMSIVGQSIEENLQYINGQFEQFNKYETSFDVNEVTKTITCQDKFGMYSSFLKDIEINSDESGENIGIYCLDGSKCISSIKKDGREGSNFSNYMVNLSKEGELIANVEEVIEKFSIIKKSILESDSVFPNSQASTLKYEVELQLQALNAILNANSQDQNNWYFDWDSYWLIEETDSCKVHIPLEKTTIEYSERENVQSFRHGFVFKSEDEDIFKKCSSLESNVNKTHFYLDNQSNAEGAIISLKAIQELVSNGPAHLSPITPNKSIDEQLSYINDQFQKYNKYNTRFFVDLSTQELIWVQDFGETRASLDQIEFKADYENEWFLIFCKNGSEKCISYTSPKGSKINYNDYSMSLKEGEHFIPHIAEIINKFNELANTVSN